MTSTRCCSSNQARHARRNRPVGSRDPSFCPITIFVRSSPMTLVRRPRLSWGRPESDRFVPVLSVEGRDGDASTGGLGDLTSVASNDSRCLGAVDLQGCLDLNRRRGTNAPRNGDAVDNGSVVDLCRSRPSSFPARQVQVNALERPRTPQTMSVIRSRISRDAREDPA